MHAYAPTSVWRFDTYTFFLPMHIIPRVCQPARGVCARTRWANWPWSCYFQHRTLEQTRQTNVRADWFNKAQANFAEERFMNGNVFRALENYSFAARQRRKQPFSVCALAKNSTPCILFLRC